MIKDIARIIQFAARYPSSFRNVNVWARREIARGHLTHLADSAGSDKGFGRHFYTRVYDDILSSRREITTTVLEIGLLRHDIQRRLRADKFVKAPSLDMWAHYFPHARVFGVDNKDFSDARGLWAKIVQADQSVREELSATRELAESFDIIVDDALHASYHQQVSFSYLFQQLAPRGIYVIEDLHYQPESVEVENPVGKTLDYLKLLQSKGSWNSPVATKAEKDHIEEQIQSVHLYDSMEKGIKSAQALAVIWKK